MLQKEDNKSNRVHPGVESQGQQDADEKGCDNLAFSEEPTDDSPKNVPNPSGSVPNTTSAKEKKLMFSIRNFLIVMALSIHSIFEGMAVGEKFDRSLGLQFQCSVGIWILDNRPNNSPPYPCASVL